MQINVTYNSSVNGAPAGFTTVVGQVVQFYETEFSDPVTINVHVGYGEVAGNSLSGGALGESDTVLDSFSYTQIVNALTADAKTASDNSAVASLPANDPIGGNYWVTTASAKALGLVGASGSVDGYMGFSSANNIFDYNNADGVGSQQYDFYGVVAHELSEIMGRMLLVGATIGNTANSYVPFDLFHYSAAGARDVSGTTPGYFSIDGGTTSLNTFNTSPSGDAGDWAGATINSFNAFGSRGVVEAVSAADLTTLDAIGWDLSGQVPDLVVSALTVDATSAAFQVENLGSALAGASSAGLYLSADKVITGADTLLGTSQTPSLAASGSDAESVSFTLPTNLAPGTYYLGAIADINGQVAEASEANNASPAFAVILGNDSDNSLTGTTSANVMFGFGGDDTLSGGRGADTMIGGTGNDSYVVDNSHDVVVENPGEGIDSVQSSVTYTLAANVENLTLTGTSALNGTGNELDNTIVGNSGKNTLAGLGGADHLDGGPGGVDTATYAASPSGVDVSLATGTGSGGDAQGDTLVDIANLIGSAFNDTLEGNGGNNVLNGGVGIDTVSYEHASAGVTVSLAITAAQNTIGAGIDTLTGFENLTGAAGFGNTLTGSSAVNVLTGGSGDDLLNGGGGADTMIGGGGNDTYIVDNAHDVVVENPGEGTDSVQSSVTHTLAANVENLTLTGTSALNGTGNDLDNVIVGNSGNNTLAGLGGADHLDGGPGGLDTATYAASSAGVDVSLATGTGSGGDAQGDTLVNIDNLTGSAFNDTLEGNGGNNVLNGGAGTDTVSYEHAAAGVTVSLAITTAQNTIGAGTDTLIGFENLTGAAGFGNTLTGNKGANVLTGGSGDDQLNGGAGADTLIGGAGHNTLTGGTGNDTFVFAAPTGASMDTVTDFATGDHVAVHGTDYGLAPGALDPAYFVQGSAATASHAQFVYDTGTHDLMWDADGTGVTAAVQIAGFNAVVLHSTDFIVL